MKWLSHAFGWALVGTVGAVGAGCQNSSQSSGVPQAVEMKNAKPQAEGTVVRHAHLPIDYLISGKQIVRVDDKTTGKRVWQHRVEGNTHLRVASDGIRVNMKHIYSRKLKNAHVYEIVFLRQ
jgi:hypothetical protein